MSTPTSLALVFRARGMSENDAVNHAAAVLGAQSDAPNHQFGAPPTESTQHEAIGTGLQAGLSSFSFFASGALIPVLPYLFGLQGVVALVVAAILVGVALIGTGVIVGLLSGGPPLRRALRQLLIGYGAAATTYLLGLLLGTGLSEDTARQLPRSGKRPARNCRGGVVQTSPAGGRRCSAPQTSWTSMNYGACCWSVAPRASCRWLMTCPRRWRNWSAAQCRHHGAPAA
jgi:hypothetical protein